MHMPRVPLDALIKKQSSQLSSRRGCHVTWWRRLPLPQCRWGDVSRLVCSCPWSAYCAVFCISSTLYTCERRVRYTTQLLKYVMQSSKRCATVLQYNITVGAGRAVGSADFKAYAAVR